MGFYYILNYYNLSQWLMKYPKIYLKASVFTEDILHAKGWS